ncbi:MULTISPECIES: 5-formyltetrahydrofolate cyclo-ligase [Promicromonospora]|uniref:5-formyltetrahydrofolate cyclo-ligase n=2 Tax=Promicromonospora TaxID=43676 RepID=A0ABP8Y4Z3_9MICO|nr:5-formyltetrahydrofolate cyclo-ligase [Promicromonospora umidemergens]
MTGSPRPEHADVDRQKGALRRLVWNRLEDAGVVEPGVHGHIPDFEGADAAAHRLTGLKAWTTASVIKAVPDAAQRPVRALALVAGKCVYMAVPRLAEPRPFLLLDPAVMPGPRDAAADRHEAARLGELVDVGQMSPVDLVVTGSVAVDASGGRLGKGAGYGDIEVALLTEAGVIGDKTTIVTTVHDLQVVDTAVPEAGHDFHVDLIITPTRVIKTSTRKRPADINWAVLPASMIREIPVLAARRATGR